MTAEARASGADALAGITIPEVFDERGRVNGLALAEALDVTAGEVAKSVSLTARGLRANPASPRVQRSGQHIAALLARLDHALGARRNALIWLKTPRRQLSGHSPLEILFRGDFSSVETLVYALETGQPV
jgi:hypothetical protein